MARTAGNLTDKIDRHMLHQYLWKNRDRSNFNTIRSKDLAEELGITVFTMSRIFGELAEKGFIKKVGTKYLIIEPKIAAWIPPGGEKPKQESIF